MKENGKVRRRLPFPLSFVIPLPRSYFQNVAEALVPSVGCHSVLIEQIFQMMTVLKTKKLSQCSEVAARRANTNLSWVVNRKPLKSFSSKWVLLHARQMKLKNYLPRA